MSFATTQRIYSAGANGTSVRFADVSNPLRLSTTNHSHEATDQRRRMEGDWIHASHGQSRGLAQTLASHAEQEHLQDVCARHGRADGRDGQRRGLLSRSLQEVVSG